MIGTPLKNIVNGNDHNNNGSHGLTTPLMLTQYGEHGHGSPSSFKTDEEIARELQLQYDREMNLDMTIIEPQSATNFSSPSAAFENSFRLHYYNGLRGGLLSSFLVTQQESDSIGKSVGLGISYHSPSHFGQGDEALMPTTNTLESIVRTRWPTCKIDWGGKIPPSVD
jgi:hypothetical protein